MKTPIRVAVTGAAGNIGYALLFRLASGDCFGKDQPIILQLLEITPALGALEGVVMELNDAAFPLLHGIETSDDPNVAFRNAKGFTFAAAAVAAIDPMGGRGPSCGGAGRDSKPLSLAWPPLARVRRARELRDLTGG